MSDEAGRTVTVDINGQRYPIRSGLDEEYVQALAAYVNQKVRAAADLTPTSDGLRLAVLAALNIADELFRSREGEQARNGRLTERTARLERLLDEVLIS
ncbi:MAG TPA: cell division protein ZapA [Vicinamibacterales bacterium]